MADQELSDHIKKRVAKLEKLNPAKTKEIYAKLLMFYFGAEALVSRWSDETLSTRGVVDGIIGIAEDTGLAEDLPVE